MSRRNSSLVTVALGSNISPNAEEDFPPPYTTTAVIEIGDDDEINADFPSSSSTERIFRIFVEYNTHQDGSTLEVTRHNAPGTCSKLRCWLRKCCNGSIILHGREKVSGFFTAKFRALNEKLESRSEKSYLEAYFLYANVCGVSPFRFGKENKPVTWLKKIMVVSVTDCRKNKQSLQTTLAMKKVKEEIMEDIQSQAIPYYVVNALAAIDAVRMVKQIIVNLIVAHEEELQEIQVYMLNAVHVSTILLRVGMFLSFKFQFKKYYGAIEAICTSSFRKCLYTVKSQIHSLLICGLSVCVILIKTHIGLLSGLEYYMNKNAKEALSLLCITKECHQSDAMLEGYSHTTKTAMGLLGWAMKLSGNMLWQLALDGVLFSALTLGKSANAFKFKERIKTADLENANVHEIGAEIHTEYQDIKKISKCINSAFNLVFRFFLLASVFVFAVFLDQYFNPQIGKLSKIIKCANVLIVCITFYYANVAAKTGERFREWMKEEENRNILGMSELNVLTENSSSSSIGYGRGAFFIYDSTLIGFASVVTAYFLGMVETRPQNDLEIDMQSTPCPWQNISSQI